MKPGALGRVRLPVRQGTSDHVLVKRVAGKIGMITRRATQVVARTTMPRSATQWRPGALPEGPGKRDRAAEGMPDRPRYNEGAPTSRYGVASSSGRNCSSLRGRARFYRNPDGTRLCGR